MTLKLTQVVLRDKSASCRALPVAPEFDPQLVSHGNVGRDGVSAKVSEQPTIRVARSQINLHALALFFLANPPNRLVVQAAKKGKCSANKKIFQKVTNNRLFCAIWKPSLPPALSACTST
jgi:hypothetical protein